MTSQEGNHGVVKENFMKALSQYSERAKRTKWLSYIVHKSQVNVAQILKKSGKIFLFALLKHLLTRNMTISLKYISSLIFDLREIVFCFVVIWVGNVFFLQGKPGSPGSPGMPGEPVSTDLSSGLLWEYTDISSTKCKILHADLYVCFLFFLGWKRTYRRYRLPRARRATRKTSKQFCSECLCSLQKVAS